MRDACTRHDILPNALDILLNRLLFRGCSHKGSCMVLANTTSV